MSRVITLMPVRLAATRLPNKPLRVINGKTMVQRVYENVKTALNTDIQMPFGPNSGTNTSIYKIAPIPSIINVPNNTFLTNFASPDIVLRLKAS